MDIYEAEGMSSASTSYPARRSGAMQKNSPARGPSSRAGLSVGRKLHTGEFAVRPSRERYASHLDATRSGNLAKFTAMRRASSRVSRLSMAGLCCSSAK
jgi:hypothetical protein